MSQEPYAKLRELNDGTLTDAIGEHEGAKRAAVKLATDLRGSFDAFDRLINLMRVHPPRHPLIDQLCEQVMGAFSQVLEREQVVRVLLHAQYLETEDGLRFFDQQSAERQEFVWYTAYADGIVYFEFSYGMQPRELRQFLSVINRADRNGLGVDDDTVTQLWELDFDYFSFDSIEGFVDGGIIEELGVPEPAAVEAISDALLSPDQESKRKVTTMFEQSLHPEQADVFTRLHFKASERLNVPRMRDEDLAYALGLNDAKLLELLEEWTSGATLEYRLIETLLSIIRSAPLGQEAERAGDIITQVTQQLIEQEKFKTVAKVLELMRARQEYFAESVVDPLSELIGRLTSGAQLEALLNIFMREADKRDELMALFRLLDGRAVQNKLVNLMGSEDPLRGERALVGLLFDLSVGPLEGALTRPENLQQKHYLMRVLNELHRRPLSEYATWAPSQRVLRAGLEHSWRDARLLSLEIDHPLWDNRLAAETYLKKLAFDKDNDVRQRAMARLAEGHRAVFLSTIQEALGAQDFKGRSPGEVRFLMRTYMEHVPDAPKFLMGLLEPRGWIGSGRREFAKLAATVLVEANHTETVEFLRERAASILTQPELKQHFRQLVDAWDRDDYANVQENMAPTDPLTGYPAPGAPASGAPAQAPAQAQPSSFSAAGAFDSKPEPQQPSSFGAAGAFDAPPKQQRPARQQPGRQQPSFGAQPAQRPSFGAAGAFDAPAKGDGDEDDSEFKPADSLDDLLG